MSTPLDACLKQIRLLTARPRADSTGEEAEPDEVLVLFAGTGCSPMANHPAWKRGPGREPQPAQ